jgi:hypothetical protein
MNIQTVIAVANSIKEVVKNEKPRKSNRQQAKKVIKLMKGKRNEKSGLEKNLYQIIIDNLVAEYRNKY